MIEPLVSEKEQLEEALKSLGKNGVNNIHKDEKPSTVTERYLPTMSNLNKAIYITKKNGYLTLNEIDENMHQREPILN